MNCKFSMNGLVLWLRNNSLAICPPPVYKTKRRMLIGCSYVTNKRRCFSADIDIDIYARKSHFSSTEKENRDGRQDEYSYRCVSSGSTR